MSPKNPEPFARTFLHGTRADLVAGDLIEPGRASNFGSGDLANFVYVTATLDAAIWGAELARGDAPERIYTVQATGPLADDPNVTDQRFPGNPTMSYRTRQPVMVTGEVVGWRGHDETTLQAMRDRIADLAAQGVEAIND